MCVFPLPFPLLLQNTRLRKAQTGFSEGPGLESYLKGFNFTGEPPWLLCT
uniref:Uncharacterized protein n=1 Tax=Anguilla anguilla TaxID=7936 RepID=A0A0E9SM80_ANGAN